MKALSELSKKNSSAKNSKRNAFQSKSPLPSRNQVPATQMLSLQKALGNKQVQEMFLEAFPSANLSIDRSQNSVASIPTKEDNFDSRQELMGSFATTPLRSDNSNLEEMIITAFRDGTQSAENLKNGASLDNLVWNGDSYVDAQLLEKSTRESARITNAMNDAHNAELHTPAFSGYYSGNAAGSNTGLSFVDNVLNGKFSDAVDDVAYAGFRIGDVIGTALVADTQMLKDAHNYLTGEGLPRSLEERADEAIASGHLAVGEKIRYDLTKEIWQRKVKEFVLRVDGRTIEIIFSDTVSPFPWNLDDTKAFGRVSTKDNGELNPDTYDFLPVKQKYPANATLLDKAKIYARNQLNLIAIAQHGIDGLPFKVDFVYTDNDLLYGRDNIAPWRPDLDPSYASPYLGEPSVNIIDRQTVH